MRCRGLCMTADAHDLMPEVGVKRVRRIHIGDLRHRGVQGVACVAQTAEAGQTGKQLRKIIFGQIDLQPPDNTIEPASMPLNQTGICRGVTP
jgi:hypothetical protein